MVSFSDVREAAGRIAGVAHRTPVMRCQTLDDRVGASVFLKCENFQRMGAFKFRGAFNAMSQLGSQARQRGIVTHSSGNHAQAVALCGKLLEIETTIVMPNNAPRVKRQAAEACGARIVAYDPETDCRERISAELEDRHGYFLIPPFDHPHIIAGAGTACYELIEREEYFDYVLAPCGGGGLLSGTATAAKGLCPSCQVIGVEPEVADDAARSFATGKIQTVHNPPTIADGTRTASLGKLTFEIIRERVDDFATVSEEAIIEAVRFLFERVKIVVEPSGALGIAALLSGRAKVEGKIGVILSGGNVDPETMAGILS